MLLMMALPLWINRWRLRDRPITLVTSSRHGDPYHHDAALGLTSGPSLGSAKRKAPGYPKGGTRGAEGMRMGSEIFATKSVPIEYECDNVGKQEMLSCYIGGPVESEWKTQGEERAVGG